MAAVTALGVTFDTTTGSHTVTATPAINDLIVIVCANTGITAAPTVSDNNADGLGAYTNIVGALKNTSTDKAFIFIRNDLVGSATSTVFTVTGASSTGGGLVVYNVTSMIRTGASASRQTAVLENQSSGTPTLTLASSCLTGNPTIGGIFSERNPAGMTAPTNWTEDSSPSTDVGYGTPTTGLETVRRDSGFIGTAVTWGNSTGALWGGVLIELDTSITSVSVGPFVVLAADRSIVFPATGGVR